ncbi:MAG: thiamine monophosphate kinase [Ignavibacteria bacterium]|nr:MAG: thiamine monophosphate kinase [Ignavibacteria bacterium]
MLDERRIIQLFLEALPENGSRLQPFFTTDAQTLEIGTARCLFTIDSFGEEDHFRTSDPYTLGWNLAAGTVSDIHACGGTVLHYAHSCTVANAWSEEYLSAMARGISDVITLCGARFLGGDTGRTECWQYTGVAIGRADREITRRGAQPGDRLYITGEIGSGNLEAALSLIDAAPVRLFRSTHPAMRFPVRNREARLIAHFASACMDTSDGLLRALTTISEINHTGYSAKDLPWHTPGCELLQQLGLPTELLMAGECGEYELLCTIPQSVEEEFLGAAEREGMVFHVIGMVTEAGHAELQEEDGTMDLSNCTLTARGATNHHDYVRRLTEYFMHKRHNSSVEGSR